MRFRLPALVLMALGCATLSAVPTVPAIPRIDPPPAKSKDAPAPVTPPILTGPDTAAFLATFDVSGVGPADVVFWNVTPEDQVDTYEVTGSASFVLGGPPGQYKVKAQGTAAGKKFTLEKKVKLTGGVPPVPVPPGPTPVPPGPGPQPGPQPNPPPLPSGTISRFIVVEDTTALGKWRGDILGSPKVKSFYNSLQGNRTGAIHAIYDASTKPANLSAEGQKYLALAAGKTLPYVWILDANGVSIKDQSVPKDPDGFIALFDMHVGSRSFGLVIEAPKLKWPDFGAAPNVVNIDRAQWPAFQSMSAFLPPTYDQDGVGQCASSAATGMFEFGRKMAGLPPVHVAAGDLYSRVNGGRDNGSTLEDNMVEMQTNGVNPVSASVPYVWNRRISYPATGRSPYKFAEVYLCANFDAAVSAILQGMPVQIGISWASNYTPDKTTGSLPKKASGSVGGHSLWCYGVYKYADGTFGLITRNSWSATWGGSADGTIDAGSCIIPESAFTGYIGGFYAVRSVVSANQTRRIDPLKFEHVLAF